MGIFKRLLDFYINSSIHVSLAVYAMVRMTGFMFGINDIHPSALFAFFGTIVAYNFVKYDALARRQKQQMRTELKLIAGLSFVSFLAAAYFFFQLSQTTKIIAFAFLVLTMLYTLPFFPNRKNARNWTGVKIYMVALCWVGITLFLPVIDAGIPISFVMFMVGLQRFILIFVLILIFEIIDLKVDDLNLKTVPQQIGVKNTKIVGSILLLVFVVAPFFITTFPAPATYVRIGIAITTFLFLLCANEERSKYYTSFWAESIPILWWVLVVVVFG
ncbi:hypothetical protein [Flavobacterium wongokense]|uniref:hypothetical protein n=1 Tax=Flavobacterium wongokense TaxID=2910674 RepID=UPI001F3A2F59|nr:hypothetical protein [Flavobacterium sp. WG47]MCF6133102.1 hypothetical protein [Flavobacterium sp. WG47]